MSEKIKKYKIYTIIWIDNNIPLLFTTKCYLAHKNFIETLYKGKITKREYYMDYHNCKLYIKWLKERGYNVF